MGWCKELAEYAEQHKVETKRHLAAIAILAEMADEGYAANPGKWEDKRDKAECHIYGWHFTEESSHKAVQDANKDGTSGEYWTLKDCARSC